MNCVTFRVWKMFSSATWRIMIARVGAFCRVFLKMWLMLPVTLWNMIDYQMRRNIFNKKAWEYDCFFSEKPRNIYCRRWVETRWPRRCVAWAPRQARPLWSWTSTWLDRPVLKSLYLTYCKVPDRIQRCTFQKGMHIPAAFYANMKQTGAYRCTYQILIDCSSVRLS